MSCSLHPIRMRMGRHACHAHPRTWAMTNVTFPMGARAPDTVMENVQVRSAEHRKRRVFLTRAMKKIYPVTALLCSAQRCVFQQRNLNIQKSLTAKMKVPRYQILCFYDWFCGSGSQIVLKNVSWFQIYLINNIITIDNINKKCYLSTKSAYNKYFWWIMWHWKRK